MSHPNDRFYYEAEGRKYMLQVHAEKTPHGWRVAYAEMYNMEGNYIGQWLRIHMPLRLILDLQAWCKYAAAFGVPLDGSDWKDS